MTPVERIALARESVNEAMLLRNEGIGSKVAFTKLYHALMYCLYALFNVRIAANVTHADIIDRFERELVRGGAFSEELLRTIRHAYDLTHECDCDHMPVPTEREFAGTARATVELIRETERLMRTEVHA